MLSLSLLLVELMEENEVLEDEGVNTLMMLVDDPEEEEELTEAWSGLLEMLSL